MDARQTVSFLLFLPKKFHDLGNVSVYALLAESGYLDSSEDITEEAILQGLHAQPECIQDWRIFSEDKRTTGWYLMEPVNGCYGVGYIPPKGQARIADLKYSDEASACAAFIKREIENIRIVVSRAESRRKRKPND